jgi:hypothetical protein
MAFWWACRALDNFSPFSFEPLRKMASRPYLELCISPTLRNPTNPTTSIWVRTGRQSSSIVARLGRGIENSQAMRSGLRRGLARPHRSLSPSVGPYDCSPCCLLMWARLRRPRGHKPPPVRTSSHAPTPARPRWRRRPFGNGRWPPYAHTGSGWVCGRRAAGSSAIRTSQCGGRNPDRVTVTSRRTAASDGRLLAAASA